MLSEIGSLLPLAVGIAISPLPLVATVLALMSPRARSSSVGFALGWVAGLAVVLTVAALLADVLPGDGGSGGPTPVIGALRLVLGCLQVFLGVQQWRHRPRPGETGELPRWMAAVDSMDAIRAAGLAFLLIAVNPKNLLLAFSAGLQLGQGRYPLVVGIIFVVLAGSSVVGLVLLFRLRPKEVGARLQPAREWLEANNAVVMAVLLLVMGSVVIGKALASF